MTTQNRIFLALAIAICIPAIASAQKYETGQIITIDGLNCVVVDVDSTGEHGLAAGPPVALYDKKKYSPQEFVLKKFKAKDKSQEPMSFFERKRFDCVLMADLKKKEEEKYVEPVLERLTSNSGEEVQKIIAGYCEQNNIDMKTYFPEHAWVQSLGEGWFLGGWNEIYMYKERISLSKEYADSLNEKSASEGYRYFYPLNLHSTTREKFHGRMCRLGMLWTYNFQKYWDYEYRYDAQRKRNEQVRVEKKRLISENYSRWHIGANLLGSIIQSGDSSPYYGPDHIWQRYNYLLSFKRF